jgi:zinc transporter, ZIP family
VTGAAATNVFVVSAAALVTALATGLGAVPLVFVRHATRWLARANALAALLMLGASAMLFYEAYGEGVVELVVGAVAGAAAVGLAARRLRTHEGWSFETLRGASARSALLIVGVMTLHSAAEGIGVGVSFGGGQTVGLATSAAIAAHNIPEGLAISLVLVPRGVSVRRAALWSVFSSLPQPLLALPAFLGVEAFRSALPFGLAFAGGAMVWMVLAAVLPSVYRTDAEGLAFP